MIRFTLRAGTYGGTFDAYDDYGNKKYLIRHGSHGGTYNVYDAKNESGNKVYTINPGTYGGTHNVCYPYGNVIGHFPGDVYVGATILLPDSNTNSKQEGSSKNDGCFVAILIFVITSIGWLISWLVSYFRNKKKP